MFTGIIEDKAQVHSLEQTTDAARLGVISKLDFSKVHFGASVCINGVCLTLVERSGAVIYFEIASETLRCTNLGELKPKSIVNLERSLKLGDSLDGHFVFGHVDCLSKLVSKREEGDTWRLEFELSPPIRKFITPKGSITLNGVSLTVGEVTGASFSVYVIPHTFSDTNLGLLDLGTVVNLEIDMLARYVSRQLEERA